MKIQQVELRAKEANLLCNAIAIRSRKVLQANHAG
jgi:hypothetical protein